MLAAQSKVSAPTVFGSVVAFAKGVVARAKTVSPPEAKRPPPPPVPASPVYKAPPAALRAEATAAAVFLEPDPLEVFRAQIEADRRELHAQDRLAIDGAFARTQALLDEQGTLAAQLAQRLETDRVLVESALVTQEQHRLEQSVSQSRVIAGALQEQQLQTTQLAAQVASDRAEIGRALAQRSTVTPEDMDALRSQIAQLKINSEEEAIHYRVKLDSERNAKLDAKKANRSYGRRKGGVECTIRRTTRCPRPCDLPESGS